MLNNFEKFSFPSIEKRWTKDKETNGQKEKKTANKKKKEDRQTKRRRTDRHLKEIIEGQSLPSYIQS